MIGATRPAAGLLDFSTGSEEERVGLRERFGREHCAVIPGLLDPELLDKVLDLVEDSPFYRRDHGHIGVEECMRPGPALALLLFVANDQRLVQTISDLTGCGPIGCFDGRVYRMDPAHDHHDSWHSDVGDERVVAMSVNLGREPHMGGVLEIKDERTDTVLGEVANPVPGDALIFRISEDLRHRVTAVEGQVARTVFAGWFKVRPTFREVLRGGGWLSGEASVPRRTAQESAAQPRERPDSVDGHPL